jgi:hypothetical protein
MVAQETNTVVYLLLRVLPHRLMTAPGQMSQLMWQQKGGEHLFYCIALQEDEVF